MLNEDMAKKSKQMSILDVVEIISGTVICYDWLLVNP